MVILRRTFESSPDVPISSLLYGLGDPTGSIVLGAGASWPCIPTMAEMPSKLGSYGKYIWSWPASPIAPLPIHGLVAKAPSCTRFNGDAIGLGLHQLLSHAHQRILPQYEVFQWLPSSVRVVSFNWDGLARARCPQRSVIHPHGAVRPIVLTTRDVSAWFDAIQFNDDSDGKRILGSQFVFMGEETASRLARLREQIHSQWSNAATVTIIGYSFGLHGATYDRIWRELFVDAMRRNPATVHIVDPFASTLRDELCWRFKREANIFAWPYSWAHLAAAALQIGRKLNSPAVLALARYEKDIRHNYEFNQGVAA